VRRSAIALALAACASHHEKTIVDAAPPAPIKIVDASMPSPSLTEGDRTLSVNGATIAVHIRGHGPPCLAQPGGPGLEWTYLRMPPEVEQSLTMIYVEPLGTGGSSRADKRELTRTRYAADLEGVRAALGLEKMYLLGHSYGGTAVQLYAIAHPDRLLGLILFDTTPRFDKEFSDALFAGLRGYAHELWYKDAMAAWGEEERLTTDDEATRVAQREMPTFFAEWSKRRAELEPMIAGVHAWAAPLRGSQIDGAAFDTRAALAKLTLRALVIVGAHDAVTGPRFAAELHTALAGSTLVTLEHSGHMGHLEDRDAFAAAITNFVNGR
jgi:proline iminopeptidase